MPPAHDGTDGTSGYLILKISRSLSDSIASREQKRKVILSEQDFLGEAFKVITQDPAKEPHLEKLSEIVTMTNKIGCAVQRSRESPQYLSFCRHCANKLLSKLENLFPTFFIRLQQQAVQLTKSLESK